MQRKDCHPELGWQRPVPSYGDAVRHNGGPAATIRHRPDGEHLRGGADVRLAAAQPECLPHRSDSRRVGEGKAENQFVSTGLDVTFEQAGNLMRLADGESGDLFGRAAAAGPKLKVFRKVASGGPIFTGLSQTGRTLPLTTRGEAT